ncbi:MAG: HIT domain-containing protein [Anaerolineales bacterium]|nr:HIT domain-containing protein [Anaerolineales bacterium]MCW5876257.1 HIT domain-containing protein [Anaerolineales bacterium]
MQRLFSPWRKPYIQRDKSKAGECVFCAALKKPDGPENLILHRGEKAFVMLNRFPYTSGHLLALPFEHIAQLEQLTPQTRAELFELANTAVGVLRSVYAPGGFNLGANLGAAAGAGIEEHLHLHVLPRWNGDTNFMSALGQTRVLPETLEETWERLKAAWPA